MYGLFAHKEITALRTKHVYRLEIYKKDFSGTAMELEEFSSSPFSITLEGEGDEVYRPIIKSYLSINIIDKDQFDYTQFFTSDAFGFRVFLLRNGMRLWSGYITPDSFGQDLQYRSTINLVARDNIGYLSEIDYDWFDYDFVSIEQLLTKAFDKIQAQFSLDNRVNIFSGNKPITDAYIQTVGFKDKTWFEVLEEVLSGCGLQLRYINDNYTLHDIANEVELGGNYTPTFIDRSQRVDFSPAWREEQLEQDYLKIDNFFNKMPNKDKYEFIKLNNKDFSRPGERLYTIQGWNQSETNASNGILFNNPDELYYNTSFNQDTGTYIFDKIPNTSMLINSDNKTEYPNSSISTSFICKKSSTPLHINIDAFNELFEVEYYEGIGHVISRHYGFNYNTYHLNFYCNIFLKKEDGSTLICKNNTWEPYDSSNQDYRIELNLPETPDPLTAESFQEDKTQLDIVVKSIPENGDLIFTIYRWGTSYTGTLLGSFAMRIDNIKMYFKDEKEDVSGQESKITINESNNVKQSFDFKYGQIPDSSGGYLAFAGGLHDNDDYHTPLTDWYRSAFPGNKYNLLELVGRGLAHHGKKARKIMTGTILFDGQDFSKILVIDNEKYVINGGTYDVTKETLTGEFIEVEPYSTDDYVITGGAVSGGSSNISTGGNRDTLLWTDNAANTKRVNELGMATSDDLAGSNLLIDNPEWSEAKRISADMLDDKFYWDKSLDTTEDKSDKDSWIIRTKHSIVSDKGISAYGLGSTSGGSASGSLGELVNVGQWADEVPTADRVMVQLAGATHWSAKPLADLVGLDTAALAQYLTANSYLKASDISSYLTWANLSGKPTVYPTSWELVTGRPTKLSDLTDDVVAGNYLPKPTWDAVFEVVTVDGTPALKVKYDILGLKGITAYADGSLSGGFSGALVDLVDVAVTNLASGDILKYNGTHFVNVPVSSIAGASSWDQITGKPEYYPTRWADVFGAPASLPASDVYPWAKAASKPTYTAAEVGALALSGGTLTGNVITIGSFILANSGAYPQLTFRATADNSERLLFRHGNDLKWRYNGTNDGIIYHSGNFNPGNYLLLSGGTMTGDISFGSNGRSLRGSDGGNIAGVLYDTPNARYVTAIGTGSRRLILVSPASIYRGAGGVAENYMIYDSGNFNPSSKLDKSVWDEAFELKTVNGVRVISAKLDFLSVAGISAYATGPSSGGGGGGLDYDLLKQALTGAITPDGYPFTISASFLGAIDKTYLTGKLANTYADKVHTHLWADITDRPTSLPANGGNADTVDNLHASSFAQIKSYNFPSGGINNITDLDFTGNIQAHFPNAEYSCIWQGKDFAGTILQLKLRDYAGKQSMMYRGSLTKIWRTVWDSGNFNPDNKFGLSGIISDLNNAPLNAVFSTNGTPANAPLENAYFQGFTFAMDNNPNFKRQWAFKDKKIWFRNLHAGSWSAWTDVIPLDNYLPLSGGSITGGLGVSGYLTAGVLRVKATSYPQISFVNTTTNRDSLLFVNGSELYWRPTAGTATDYQVYHSGNFNPDSKLGVSSVAVEAKKMSYQGLMTAISGTTTFPAGLYLYGVYNNGYPVTYGNLLRVGGSGLGEMLFGWAGDASVGGLYYRSKRDVAATAWSNWCKLWTSANSNLSTIDWSANNLNAAANLDVAGQAYVSGWLRSRGNVGWYSQDYGGGIHMTDSTWVRVYGSKGLMIDTGTSPINMGQLQITCSAEASIGFRSASNGNWCLGKGVKSIGSGFGLYNAVTNRAAFQIDSATDNASFVGSITAPTFVGNLSGSASSVNGYDINSFTGYYKYTIDASSLDQNTYYPVTMYLGNHNTVRISVIVALDSGTKPAWSSHASGYSVRFIEEVNGSGWGTSEVSRNILANEYRFANANPVGRVEQMTNSSTEVIWVRGGGKYFFYLSIPYITPALRTSTFTNASQSVSPRTDTMDLRMAANGNGIAASKLYAHNSIEINGFTIDVYNGALRVNGNLVATGGVTSLATA